MDDTQLGRLIPRDDSQITGEWLRFVLKKTIRQDASLTFKITVGAEPGSNYATAVYAIHVQVQDEDDARQLIVKLPHDDPFGQLFCRSSQCYEREIGFYDRVAPLLEKTLGRKLPIPVYHHGVTDGSARVAMVMDDLRPAGYRMPQARQLLDLTQVQLAVAALAQVSAASLVALHEDRDQALEMKELIEDPHFDIRRLFKSERMLVDLPRAAVQGYINFLRNYEGHEMIIASLKSLLASACDIMTEGMHGSASSLRTICHGDLWKLNIMFRHTNSDSSTPDDVMLIDWQHCHFGNPMVDLFSILSNNTDRQFREQHTQEIILFFHEELSKVLTEVGLDPKQMLPSTAKMQDEYKLSMRAAMIRIIFDIVLPLVPDDALGNVTNETSDQQMVDLLVDSMAKKTTDSQLEKHLLEFAAEMHDYGLL